MKCLQQKTKCIFNREGKCDILADTHFKRPCPFYKERPLETIQDKMFNGEMYRSVRGFNGAYYVNERGDIVNWTGRPLKKGVMNRHLYVHLKDNLTQKMQKKSLAKIVAAAFIPGTGEIGYLDGDTMNCERWNLYRKGE